jgi:hypothetical protein
MIPYVINTSYREKTTAMAFHDGKLMFKIQIENLKYGCPMQWKNEANTSIVASSNSKHC